MPARPVGRAWRSADTPGSQVTSLRIVTCGPGVSADRSPRARRHRRTHL